MHQTILIQRRAAAKGILISSSKAIIEHLELDAALLESFTPPGSVKDNDVKDMMILEAAAALMQHLAILSGSIQEGVTAVTEDVDMVTPLPPFDETPLTPENSELAVVDQTTAAAVPEDLPAPVIEDAPAVEESATIETAAEPIVEETPVVEAPAAEGRPAEEKPAPKKSSRSKSKK